MRVWMLVALFSCGCDWVCACPAGCSCVHEQGLYSANCSSLPYSGGKVQVLTLRPHRDTPLELSDGQFNAARHLKYLDLKNCSIYFVHKKAFYGAKNVQEIDLSFNYIEDLEPTVFQHLTSLTTIVLRGNPIKFVTEVPFLISSSLQHLDIGQCKIKSVPRGIFYGMKRLKYLSMDGNYLTTLKYNSLPKGLKYLSISQNHIVNVPTEVLSSLTHLRRIGLTGNPINCSCSLMNLQDWLSGRGVIFEDDVLCELPDEYNGISWSKVDENRLCLAEARREEISHSSIYSPLSKSRSYTVNYFENENSNLGEYLQSDQPQPVHPDPKAEVLFQNDKTLAMGEMMRDEEDTTGFYDNKQTNLDIGAEIEKDKDSALVSKVDTEKKSTEDELDLDHGNVNVEIPNPEGITSGNVNKETVLMENDSEATNMDLQGSNEKIEEEESRVKAVDTQINSINQNIEVVENKNDSLPMNIDNIEVDKLEASTVSQSAILNESNPVEYKTLYEVDSNTELDDLKREGFFHVENDKYSLNSNDTNEESTAVPIIEDTTEYEENPTQDPLSLDVPNEEHEENDQNSTSITTTEQTNNVTIVKGEEDYVMETAPPAITIPELSSANPPEPTEEHRNESELFIGPQTNLEDNTFREVAPDSTIDGLENKIKEAAGAEVVMFCVVVLLLCLILYSVYKCRASNKRQNIRTSKDVESSRGTEMQDMASLLPKPQDDKKNNLKYPDKAPSTETVKLLTEQNENETPNFIPAGDSKTKIEDKNSLNNNSPLSPTSKTPLIKQETPITISPAAPIQRTKVKVGILPDSIPRTPIFLQKTYNNGTKHV